MPTKKTDATPEGGTAAPTATSLAQVLMNLRTVSKSALNKFGGYDYATADDVFDAVRPLLGKAGLVFDMDEIETEFLEGAKGKRWAKVTYRMRIRPEGERPTVDDFEAASPWERRTVLVQVTGPQSLGAAASYAAKYYLRTKLLLSTGEADLDAEDGEALADDDHPPETNDAPAPAPVEDDGWPVEGLPDV